MIEYHIWITLSDFDALGESNLTNLRERIAYEKSSTSGARIEVINGLVMLSCCAAANHPSSERKSLHNLIEYILNIAPNSYGLVYFWDDEKSQEAFEVWVVRDRKTIIEKDPFNLAKSANI